MHDPWVRAEAPRPWINAAVIAIKVFVGCAFKAIISVVYFDESTLVYEKKITLGLISNLRSS